MGLFDFLKKKEPQIVEAKTTLQLAPTMNNAQPFYSSFGENVYASDIVVQSIRCKANEMKKLNPRHIRGTGNNAVAVNDSSIAKVLKRPNEYMTMADFLEKICVLRELNKNVYIYPAYYMTKGGERYYTGLYPLKPTKATYLTDAGGRYFIKFEFATGYSVTLPLSDVIHWRKDYGVNDYFGGSGGGFGDSAALLSAIDRYDKLCQSIAKAVEVSCQINGIVKVNTYMTDEAKEQDRADFVDRLQNNKAGIIYEDLKTEFTPIPHDVKIVDAETLKFFHETITRANGVSVPILNGDYTKAQKEAFYEHALEADIISLGQAMSRTLFTDREASFGNEIVLYPSAIEFMSMENKIAVATALMPSGSLRRNEVRALFGYPPLTEAEGGDEIPQGYNLILNGKGGADDAGTEK
jgi:HK97 family phage portal protein